MARHLQEVDWYRNNFGNIEKIPASHVKRAAG
jgi:hypothetical protein